jgi:hypothetical protein
MKRTGYLGVSLFAILTLATSILPPAFGQDKQPQAKTRQEYDAYLALYNEKDPAKKAELGEKFIADFKESDFIPNAHTMIIGGYTNSKNWAKVITAADRAVALPNADNKLKAYAYANAMVAAQNLNDVDKVVLYGEKVLAIDANDLNALITLSQVIPAKLPADAAAKNAALDKAANYATKALTGIEPLLAKADAAAKPQFIQIRGNLHATLGLVAYNRPDYQKSIQEYDLAIKDTPKDDVAHYYLGLNYQALAAQVSKAYTEAVNAFNDAKAAKKDQPTLDELDAKQQGLANDVRTQRDKAIDEFAIATAIGGPLAAQAKDTLTKLWVAKNDNTDGLDAFVAQKKQQL